MTKPIIEKALIAFLAALLILGIAIRHYNQKRSHVAVSIAHVDPGDFAE